MIGPRRVELPTAMRPPPVLGRFGMATRITRALEDDLDGAPAAEILRLGAGADPRAYLRLMQLIHPVLASSQPSSPDRL